MRKLINKSKKLLHLSVELSKSIDSTAIELNKEVRELDRLFAKLKYLIDSRKSISTTQDCFSSGYMFNAFNYKLKLTEDINDVELKITKQRKKVSKIKKTLRAYSVKKIAADKIIQRLNFEISKKQSKVDDSEIESFSLSKAYKNHSQN